MNIWPKEMSVIRIEHFPPFNFRSYILLIETGELYALLAI